MPDVRWPREWESDRDPITGEYWAFSPTILARDVGKVVIYVPLTQDGKPDIDGLIARLRLDPTEVADLRAEMERLREALEAILGEIADEAAGHETEWPAWVRRVWQIAVRAASGQEGATT